MVWVKGVLYSMLGDSARSGRHYIWAKLIDNGMIRHASNLATIWKGKRRA